MSRKVTYEITVKTEAQYSEASTDAKMSIKLVGESGLETEWCLLDRFWHTEFRKGQVDEFSIECKDVGLPVIVKIKLVHGYFRKDIWAGDEIIVTLNGVSEYFPLHEWVDEYVEIARCRAHLPQNVTNDLVANQRRAEIVKNKRVYGWCKKEPDAVLPRHHAAKLYRELPNVFKQNDIKQNYFDKTKKISRWNVLMEVIQSYFEKMTSLNDFKKLFSAQEIPADLPAFISSWDSDEEFGRQILNGINPCQIKRCDVLPKGCLIQNGDVKFKLRGKTLKQAMQDGHIYIINYFNTLKGVERNRGPNGMQLFCADSLCLFYSGGGYLVPIAVQLEEGNRESIFTSEDKRNDWLLAKMYFRCTDSNYQEWVAHYLLTHSVTEAVCICLFRSFPRVHPIYKLLRPHLHTVPAINTLARETLISPNATANLALSVRTLNAKLLPHYYYRDDILMLWKVIGDFVSEVIENFYKADVDVREDHELQDFIQELAYEGFGWDGNLRDVPSKFNSIKELEHFCTTIIATSSIQHAATNFGQFEIYKYIPNAPSGMRRSIHKKGEATPERIMESLPDTKMAVIKLSICYALSQFSPDEVFIGDFPRKLFHEGEVHGAFARFRRNLAEAGRKITERNRTLLYPYEYLHPSRVPASIAV